MSDLLDGLYPKDVDLFEDGDECLFTLINVIVATRRKNSST